MSAQAKSVVAWIIIGLIAGWLASIVVGGGGGLIGYIIAGLSARSSAGSWRNN